VIVPREVRDRARFGARRGQGVSQTTDMTTKGGKEYKFAYSKIKGVSIIVCIWLKAALSLFLEQQKVTMQSMKSLSRVALQCT
jgi:hypothetical protein